MIGYEEDNSIDWNKARIGKFIKQEILQYPRIGCICLTHEEVMEDILKFTDSDILHAQQIFQKMVDLGLELCSTNDVLSYNKKRYNITEFGNIRGYLHH